MYVYKHLFELQVHEDGKCRKQGKVFEAIKKESLTNKNNCYIYTGLSLVDFLVSLKF